MRFRLLSALAIGAVFILFEYSLFSSYPNYTWITSFRDYWYATISAVIGTILGISFSEWRLSRKEIEKRLIFRENLLQRLDRHAQLTNQALDQIKSNNFPNFPLDTAALVQSIERCQELFPSEILNELDSLRFQLEHAGMKLHMLYTIAAQNGTLAAANNPERQSTILHLEKILKWIDANRKKVSAIEPNAQLPLFCN